MNKNYVTLEWVDIPVYLFLDDQKKFLTDAEIICGGFGNILIQDKNCAENFLAKLDILYAKILERYHIIIELSDKIVWKQDVYIGMWNLLQDIWEMRQKCETKIWSVVH